MTCYHFGGVQRTNVFLVNIYLNPHFMIHAIMITVLQCQLEQCLLSILEKNEDAF